MAKLRMAHASTHGARKPPGPKKKEEERTMVTTMAKLHMAHASTHGARMPPGLIMTLDPQTICMHRRQEGYNTQNFLQHLA